jgi:hypothetical protein
MENEYEKQANDFLDKTNTKMEVEFLYCGKHFEGDEQKRDIYLIKLTNSKHSYEFKFGQSIVNSARYNNGRWEYMIDGTVTGIVQGASGLIVSNKCPQKGKKLLDPNFSSTARRAKTAVKPTAYDVLAGITKYNPYSFSNFCDDYGYDNDSISAKKIFRSVEEEWENVRSLWSEEELEILQEIN